MSESASISSGIAARYATAVFELAKDGDGIDSLEQDVDALDAALSESGDFRSLIRSPIYSRNEQESAVAAIAAGMELSGTMANALGLMASRRRLFVLPQLVIALRRLIADERGEVTAEVLTASILTEEQGARLAAALKASVRKEVKMNVAVDEGLIGGLVVRVGSKMIDTSIASRLAALQNTMNEVG
ncbi:MAG: F0F1 ATP synthase subunit delta [Boseongicola sp. SB0676_bin_33]|nr:F0F1 ATP synthase subunit delta [Boseongicola sp. SB0676_bin_33]MYK31553.1 F0F1 ATP synthase subunit delta [Boseongicola sp. SB0670_bin_30]